MKSVDLIERIIINKYCFFTLFSIVKNLTMSIIFLVKKIFVKRRSEQYQKSFFYTIQCMYITCEKPCYQISSKDVPFRPRWMSGTRLASFKNETRLSKCRFTVVCLPCMTLRLFFIRLLSEKLSRGCPRHYIIIHSIKSF